MVVVVRSPYYHYHLCSFWNKFNDALRLDLEPGVAEVALAGHSFTPRPAAPDIH